MKCELKKGTIIFIIMFLTITFAIGSLCFGYLKDAATSPWDEARHGVNAYEMMQTKEYWIHTYNYETDYFNYKPPLSFWCIMLSYQIFGVSLFSMRFYAAVSLFLLFIAVSLFLWKRYGKTAAGLFGILLLSCKDLFFLHMGRQADADSLFVFLYTLGMLCLFYIKDKPWLSGIFGLMVSMAFMSKCFHVATLLLIGVGIYFWNDLYKILKLKHYAAFLTCAGLPVFIWAIMRYRFDGMAFFSGMLGIEVIERVEGSNNYLGYLNYIFTSPVYLMIILSAFVLLIISRLLRKKAAEQENGSCILCREDKKIYLLWFLAPLAVYSVSGAYMQWYIYPSIIPVLIVGSICIADFLKTAWTYNKWVSMLGVVPVIFCLLAGGKSISGLPLLVNEGNSGFRRDIYQCMNQNEEYLGSTAYIENISNEYLDRNFWEQTQLLEAEFAGDLKCVNGGVPAFLEDKNGILIISKDLFEEYSGVLTGRIILLDGDSYLVFSNEFY